MKRFAMTVLLKDDPALIKQYEEYHANVWPEVVEGSKRCGILRTFIYRYGRQLFMFMETVDEFDLERDMPKYMEHPRAQEWDFLMRGFLESRGAPEGTTWVSMKEIYASED